MKKVVLHLLSSNRFSGAENVAMQIISGFKKDYDIDMYYCSPDGPIREYLNNQSVKYIGIGSMKIAKIKEVINDINPTIIHAHDMRASLYASLAAPHITLISHIHNNSYGSRGISLKSIAYIIPGLISKHIFWVSKAAYEGYIFHKLFKKKSSILMNVIDVDELKNKVSEDTNSYNYDVVFLGRLTYPKNPHRLIKVLQLVCNTNPSTKIAIIGDGDLREEVLALIRDCNLLSNIDYLGFQNNPYKILSSSKLMIMTSRWEGLPMCSLEAMSLGVPLVSTPTDGLKEIITSGIDGILDEDDLILASSVIKIITDADYHKYLSDNAVSKANNLMNIQNYIYNIASAYGILK